MRPSFVWYDTNFWRENKKRKEKNSKIRKKEEFLKDGRGHADKGTGSDLEGCGPRHALHSFFWYDTDSGH